MKILIMYYKERLELINDDDVMTIMMIMLMMKEKAYKAKGSSMSSCSEEGDPKGVAEDEESEMAGYHPYQVRVER